MERNNPRGQARSYNGAPPELRRPHSIPSGLIDNSTVPASSGDNNNSSAQSNVMIAPLSSCSGDFLPSASRNKQTPFDPEIVCPSSVVTPRLSYSSVTANSVGNNHNSSMIAPGPAPEFVPSASRNQTTAFEFSSEAKNVPSNSATLLNAPVTEAVLNSKLSPLAKEFVPRTFTQEEVLPITVNPDPTALEYVNSLMEEFIDEVTLNPGKFEEEVILLTESLNDVVKTDNITKCLVDIIFSQAILEPNFRYNGARLCKHLHEHLVTDPKAQTFKFLLLEKCQTEYEQREMYKKSNPFHLRGMIFFFGEIYSQVLQNGERIGVLRVAIICLVDALLGEPSPDNLKCVCQVLKSMRLSQSFSGAEATFEMTGANLEDDERKLSQQEKSAPDFQGLDYIFNKLKLVIPPRELQSMVSSVIQLRSIDWGRNSIRAQPQPPPPPQPPASQDLDEGAIFYGPDGQPITNEEALFLESQTYGYDYRIDNYDDDFNDEIAAEYESFLREMGQ